MRNQMQRCLILAFTSILLGTLPAAAVNEAGPPDAKSLFDSSRLVEVEIELPADDWEKLRKQTRGLGGFAAMFSNPAAKPFTYFKGDV